MAEGCIETDFGSFRTIAYASELNHEYHLALVRGEVAGREGVLVRMHSRCVYGDVFGSTQCDCGRLLRGSLRAIAEEGAGVLVYLHETGPGFRIERERSANDVHTCRRRALLLRTAASCIRYSTSMASAPRFSPIWDCIPSAC